MYSDWQIGQRTAAEYVTEARRWARALKRLDPGIRLVSCGQTGMDDWDRVVIDGLAPHVDFHSIHLYTGSADYWSNVLAPHYAERALSVAGALIHDAKATGVMTVHEVTGDSPEAVNTLARPGAVCARNSKRDVEGEYVDITFSPHSFTVLEVPLA